MSDEILEFVKDRGIKEVVHFTTNHGLLGILSRWAICSRQRLDIDKYLENIALPNCEVRKDPQWLDYINLSISVVNNPMLGSSQRWHDRPADSEREAVWWAVLAFSPEILADEGVWFTTTNNTYSAVVRRGQGIDGLRDLYSEPIPWGYYGSVKTRIDVPHDQPTDVQAEVLYPGELSLSKLQAVYVPRDEHLDEIEGWFGAFNRMRNCEISCRPEVFQ
ncbi:DarT ssDNA thymidine ADP-ribosyltransferase family protein [Nocardia asteroides]|uniref:DarT ssDNA thymidine ADP-ribosyltransferase family protein n=1 Tax=Nocardia asteroides TaxID=1824 RepID=UPI001E40B9A8|nr:DarT ssDNA thymidine ADP-ribosyltransferase family protein [Nocardia asteroides]UGT62854.1 DUF4433 domain-containing protein [Nocardia asteroides]